MKILYYDCFSGISGDMNLAAMIDLGTDQTYLRNELQKLFLDHYELKISKDQRKGITGTRVDVVTSEQGHEQTHPYKYNKHQRTFPDITGLIGESALSEKVKSVSLDIFTRLAQAEAGIHGCTIDEVHFHEIGALDSIIDIVGAAICLDYFNIDKIFSSPVQVGGGFVKCAHGTFPVPAPATMELLRGIPVKSGLVQFETTTPTGAAILAATVSTFTESINFTARKVGYGIGHRDMEIPNVLRLYLGDMGDEEIAGDVETGEVLLIECNIDDMNSELYEDVMEQLFENGAHDVFFTPIIMKKSRPAVKISVLCSNAERKAITEILLLRTSTLGLRTHRATKTMLRRTLSKKSTKYGEITFKDAYYGGRKIKSKPEYDDLKRLAKEKGVSIKEIYESLKAGD